MRLQLIACIVSLFTCDALAQEQGVLEITRHAKPYEVSSVQTNSMPGRKRLSAVLLAPTALTSEDRAGTALAAAVDFVLRGDANVAEATIEIDRRFAGQGIYLAIARYALDGGGWPGWSLGKGIPFYCGTWEVRVTNYIPTRKAIEVTEFWIDNENRFMRPDHFGGVLPDEDRLAAYVAAHFHMSDSELDRNLIFEHEHHDYYRPPQCVHK